MAEYTFQIITTGGVVFDGPAVHVSAPGWDGSLGVLSGHAPMICGTHHGAVAIQTGGTTVFFAASEGVLEVRRDKVLLLTPWAEQAATLEAARQGALESMRREGAARPSAKS